MVILGITGGIGSGKSFISSLLREKLNVPVYDCDTEAKRLICDDETIKQKLTEVVGAKIYKEGELQKKVLADYLFANKKHAQKINAIVHPAVKADFCRWTERQNAKVIAVESAILYESGFDALVDKVLFVNAPLKLRIQRTMKRDGSSQEQVEARINMQQALNQFTKADYVIDNGGVGSEVLMNDLQTILKKISVE
jgi:dephospho-CoA kinase